MAAKLTRLTQPLLPSTCLCDGNGLLCDVWLYSFWSDFIAQLDHSEDMSMHISTCTIHNYNALMLVVWKLLHF